MGNESFFAPQENEICEVLEPGSTIAIVGLSPDEEKASNRVARYLMSHGYNVIPVNPAHGELMGKICYAALADIPGPVHIAAVFRRSAALPDIARQAVAKDVVCLWMQDGVFSAQAAKIASKAGIFVLQNLCIKREHHRLMSGW